MRSSGNKSAVTIGTLGDDEPLPELSKIFPRPSWQLQACVVSVLINPLMYRVYQILVTIGYILCPIGTSGSFSASACKLRIDAKVIIFNSVFHTQMYLAL